MKEPFQQPLRTGPQVGFLGKSMVIYLFRRNLDDLRVLWSMLCQSLVYRFYTLKMCYAVNSDNVLMYHPHFSYSATNG